MNSFEQDTAKVKVVAQTHRVNQTPVISLLLLLVLVIVLIGQSAGGM